MNKKVKLPLNSAEINKVKRRENVMEKGEGLRCACVYLDKYEEG